MLTLRKGFTIVEVLVAIFLLSIVITIPLTDLFIRTNVNVRNKQTALSLQRDLLEGIRVISFDDPLLFDDGDASDLDDTLNPDYVLDTVTVRGIRFVRFYNIADDVPSGGMKTIKVFVRWNNPIGNKTNILKAITIKNYRW